VELTLAECDAVTELLLDALSAAVAVLHVVALTEWAGDRDAVVVTVDDAGGEKDADPDALTDRSDEAVTVSETAAVALSLIDCVVSAVVDGEIVGDSVADDDADAIAVSETLGEADGDKDGLPEALSGGVFVVAAVAVSDKLDCAELVVLADIVEETEAESDVTGDSDGTLVGVSNGDVDAESVDDAVVVVEIDTDADDVEKEDAEDVTDGDDEREDNAVAVGVELSEPVTLAEDDAENAAVDELELEMEADSLEDDV
jgi:hypothetical protein